MENKRRIGTEYEILGAEFLEQKGYKILERNFRCRQGEIDLIAEKDGVLCFVEVKYRKNAAYGYPEEAVSYKKQMKLRMVAEFYLVYRKLPLNSSCRFDVIAVEGQEIRHIINAF